MNVVSFTMNGATAEAGGASAVLTALWRLNNSGTLGAAAYHRAVFLLGDSRSDKEACERIEKEIRGISFKISIQSL